MTTGFNRRVIFCSTEIIDKIKQGGQMPYRPQVTATECNEDMKQIMQKCWSENPNDRPNINHLVNSIKKLNR